MRSALHLTWRCLSASARLATEAAKGKPQPEKLSGPIAKLAQLFGYLKRQVTEDSIHYERAAPYEAPVDRRRAAVEKPMQHRAVAPNDQATGVVVTEQSKWAQQWQQFTANNRIVNSFYDIRMRFDESDNVVVRSARSFTDVVSDRFGSMFEDDESNAVLSGISRMDPTFDKTRFILHLEKSVIPAVLEAFIAGDLETLKDWCAEPCFKAMEASIDARRSHGLHFESKVLDLSNVEFLMAKRMDEGPVLIFSFVVQQTKCVRDRTGAIVEGAEDAVQQAIYIFAMRRDPNIFDPLLCWQVLEIGEQHTQPVW